MTRSAWGRVVVLMSVVGVGCGDDDGGSTPAVDARPPDAAAPDATLREGLWYVMDTMRIPETAQQANMVGLDIDGNDQPDNAFGALLAALHSQADLPIAAGQMDAVESGRILHLVGIDAASLDDAPAVPVLVSPGADLDGDAADNFSGAEPFALEPLDGADGELEGSLAAGRLVAGPGTAAIPLAFFGVEPEIIALPAAGARVAALGSDGGLTGGRLGGGLRSEEVDAVLIPAMAHGVDGIVRRDCPGGTCQAGSQGEELAVLFDDNGDGEVPVEEFRENSLIASTIGNPDLDLFDVNGDFNPRMDGVKDSLSFCLGFTAVGARAYE